MRMPPDYLASLLVPPDATLMALVNGSAPEPTPPAVGFGLSMAGVSGDIEAVDDVTRENLDPEARWAVALRLPREDGGEPERVWIWLAPSPADWLGALFATNVSWKGVLPEDRAAALSSEWAVHVRRSLDDGMLEEGDAPLVRFHWLVRVLDAVCAEAAFVIDIDALAFHSAAWLRDVAAARSLPHPDTLFTVHAVYADETSPVWLHSHGLARCGAIELEMLDVPRDVASEAGTLLNAVAAYMIEQGVPPPDESFWPGRGMELVWVPWEEGIRKSRGVGTTREDRDGEEHRGARGVLYVPARGFLGRRKHKSVAALGEALSDNPVFYRSNMETERAAQLAFERLDRFRALQARYGGEWGFVVKLGYPTDPDGDDDDVPGREHLWFDVHAMGDNDVDATLMNEPYAIASLSEGDRGSHDLALLSDWQIYCEHGTFGPDQIAHLERIIASGE